LISNQQFSPVLTDDFLRVYCDVSKQQHSIYPSF
jgi:hypothetical protein